VRAIAIGIIARPGGPVRLLDLPDGVTFLLVCEAVLRESEQNSTHLDGLYASGLTAGPAPAVSDEEARLERAAQIDRALRLFGG